MGTKNNPGSYDCYANLDPDEPYFCTRCGYASVCRKDYVGDE